MAVLTTHGVIKNKNPESISQRNMIDFDVFSSHLKEKTFPYVSLKKALTGHGDALTLDDSTIACYEAALLARKYGHEVTFFINTAFLKEELLYTPSLVDYFIDTLKTETVRFIDQELPAKNLFEKKKVRIRIKYQLLPYSYQQQLEVLENLYNQNSMIFPRNLPHFYQTLTWTHIRELSELGVDIQNHGAWHTHPGLRTWSDTCKNIKEGFDDIKKNIGKEALFFAVPFGDALPYTTEFPDYIRYWLMLTDTLFPGQVGLNTFNRINLDI